MSDAKKVALLILGKKAPSGDDEPEGAEPSMGDEGAKRAMRELGEALKAGDHAAAWEAYKAAHDIACGGAGLDADDE